MYFRKRQKKKKSKMRAWIPARVGNRTVIRFLDLLRGGQRVFGRSFPGNREKNEAAFPAHEAAIRAAGGFVEDQNRYGDMVYGRTTMRYAGCEIFAAYNIIVALLGRTLMSLPEMIEAFEKDGMVLSGKFGTAPKAIRDFLRQQGFSAEMTAREREFDEFGKRFEGLILTMYNDRNDIGQEVHTVAVSKDAAGFTAHNVYGSGRVVGPCAGLSELIGGINGGRAKGIALIGVSRRQKDQQL